ncbi:hypothetical protein PI124_g12461 [Phytophthora idaei]|nr:hypothetical protein PI124_g12461 [Phytophthora idaei]
MTSSSGAFQRLLSEAESDTHVGVSEEGKCQEDDPPNATTSVRSCLRELGFVSDGDDELVDEVVVPREYPNDADMSDDEVALVDEAFIESLGGSLDMNHNDKDALRETGWGSPSSAFEADPASYPHLHMMWLHPSRS